MRRSKKHLVAEFPNHPPLLSFRKPSSFEPSNPFFEYQLELDEQAFRKCMEEQAREQAKIDVEQEKLDKERREEQEYEEKNV
ncbi:hypothetical protein Tco_0466462, partial [Tanacetum coccineum]